MDDAEEDSKYPSSYGMNQGYGSSRNPKATVHNVPYNEDEAEEEEEDEQEQEEIDEETNDGHSEMNGAVHEEDDIDVDEEDDEGDDRSQRNDSVNQHRHPKKRKLKSLLSSYEFAPRVPAPPKPLFGGRNTLTDWSEHETFVLLEAWGERFLQCGRKSLRSDEWQEVADKVSQGSKIERTDSQCRNRLDTLKKKYKKEKANLEASKGVNTTWVYFKKMDMLMSSNSQPLQPALSHGVDSGGYASVNPSVNLNSANRLDETRDGTGNSDSQEGDDDSDSGPPKKSKPKGDKSGGGGGSLGLLADSVNKFSEIYEKIENSKIQQMVELENMRMDFFRDLELQKRQILDRARDEIAKIRRGDYEENDVSADNVSG